MKGGRKLRKKVKKLKKPVLQRMSTGSLDVQSKSQKSTTKNVESY